MSQLFLSNATAFEAYSKETSYTVYVITKYGSVEPATFSSKTKAIDFARDFTDEDSQVYIYKTKCIKVFDSPLFKDMLDSHLLNPAANPAPTTKSSLDILANVASHARGLVDYNSSDDEDYVPDDDNNRESHDDVSLNGLEFKTYGRGYLLIPSDDCEFYGEPYLLSGWWNDSANGWFFKREFYDELINHGALFLDTSGTSHASNVNTPSPLRKSQTFSMSKKSKSSVESDTDLPDVDLSGFAILRYGKGYLLTAPKNHPSMKAKTKYLVGNLGWWNSNANGWFFRKGTLKDLRAAGAKMIKDEPLIKEKIDLTGMTIVDYGLGYVVTGPESNKHMRAKKSYLVGKLGWWNTTANGWFFQTKYLADLERFGAVREGTIVIDDTSENEYICEDSQFDSVPTFEKYGK